MSNKTLVLFQGVTKGYSREGKRKYLKASLDGISHQQGQVGQHLANP
jgi:hypothetical protein